MRLAVPLLLLLSCTIPAQAHFIYLVPDKEHKSFIMVFSDSLEPDEGVLISKIEATKLFGRDLAGKPVEVKTKLQKHHIDVSAGAERPVVVGGVCRYGVLTKKGEPFLLMYYPKSVLLGPDDGLIKKARWLFDGCTELPLEIVATAADKKLRVLFQGKSLAGAEVSAMAGGADGVEVKGKTDAEGLWDVRAALDAAGAKFGGGPVGILAKHVEKKDGELDGAKYKEVRHYATFVVRPHAVKEFKKVDPKIKARVSAPAGDFVVALGDKDKADPAATKLLAEARAARTIWKDFPGFTANVAINQDGKLMKGRVDVASGGKVTLKSDLAELTKEQDETLKAARIEIGSLVAHRLPGGPYDTPCAFADAIADHPQGRLINVLNDELHSSYRIRDRQILEVNRQGAESRFTISVLENLWTKEKTYLPVSYVVNTWDKSGALKSSQSHHNTWVRVGSYDLPATTTAISGGTGSLRARTLTFSDHKLATK